MTSNTIPDPEGSIVRVWDEARKAVVGIGFLVPDGRVVTCDPADQHRRLTELRGLTAEEAEARIAAQPPQEAKLPFADVVIDNSGTLAATRDHVRAAWGRTVGAKISP